MKRTLYSLLLIFLLSCGGNPRMMDNPDGTFYFMKNGNLIDGALIAVRDSSLLIRRYWGMRDTSLSNSYMVLPLSEIDFVEFGYHDNSGGGILGFLTGAAAAVATVIGIGNSHGSDETTITMLSSLAFYGGGILGCYGGCYLDKEGSRYYPYRKNDLKYLRTRSAHPNGEPEELKKIK
jgi:hypothetical protein